MPYVFSHFSGDLPDIPGLPYIDADMALAYPHICDEFRRLYSTLHILRHEYHEHRRCGDDHCRKPEILLFSETSPPVKCVSRRYSVCPVEQSAHRQQDHPFSRKRSEYHECIYQSGVSGIPVKLSHLRADWFCRDDRCDNTRHASDNG